MKRLLINKIVLSLCTLSAILGIVFLGWILTTLFIKGISSFHFSLFVNDLINGGLRNLIIGQFILVGLASIVGIPLGMVAGIYIRE
ncbi:MAG: hypothetical protein L3J44_10075 [Campylobacteraceae bacterium]|nr:hypothetical protein [Campylobacteraceae bacterium]